MSMEHERNTMPRNQAGNGVENEKTEMQAGKPEREISTVVPATNWRAPRSSKRPLSANSLRRPRSGSILFRAAAS